MQQNSVTNDPVSDDYIRSLWKGAENFSARYTGTVIFRAALKSDKNINLSYKRVSQILHEIPLFVQTKKRRFRFPRRKYHAGGFCAIWQADIGQLHAYIEPALAHLARPTPKLGPTPKKKKTQAPQNEKGGDYYEGKKYFLAVCDVFSSRLWCRIIKDKSAAVVLEAFKSILKEVGTKPVKLETDLGSEFIDARFQDFCKSENIYYHSKRGDKKAMMVEYQIYRIKAKFGPLLRDKLTKNWPAFFQQVVNELNDQPSPALGGLKPNDFSTIWDSTKLDSSLPRAQKDPDYYQQLKNQQEYVSNKKNVLQKGTYVLKDSTKDPFGKVHDWQRSPQVFQISEVRAYIRPPLFLLKTLKEEPFKGLKTKGKNVKKGLTTLTSEPVEGYFYRQQLHKTSPPTAETTFQIEDILAERGTDGKEECLVKFIGFPDKYNRWLPKKDVVDGYE
jgi:hypothetical protein